MSNTYIELKKGSTEVFCKSDVSITNNYNASTGTEIGKITVNGVATALYAPTSTVNYSGDINITGAVYFDTFSDLKTTGSGLLKEGDIAITKGYYNINDGGGSTYNIVSSLPTYTVYGAGRGSNSSKDSEVDDVTLVNFNNGLYADIILNDNKVNIKLLGGKCTICTYDSDLKRNLTFEEAKVDNTPSLKIYKDLCDRRALTFTLFIPAGLWAFSATDLKRSTYPMSGCHIEGVSPNAGLILGCSVIIPYEDNQTHIWETGGEDSAGSYYTKNQVLKNLYFTTGLGLLYANNTFSKGSVSYFCLCALNLHNCSGCYFDGLYFQNFNGSCMYMREIAESYFGYINIRMCGGVRNGQVNHLIYVRPGAASAISAVYFDYFNVEGSFGSLFYALNGANFTHCEINDIQWEASIGSDGVLGRIYYTTDPTLSKLITYSDDTYSANNSVILSEGNMSTYGITKEMIYNNLSTYLPTYDGADEKFFVFDGACGYNPIIVNTITINDFGCMTAWVDHDSNGDAVTDDDGNYVVKTARLVAVVGTGVRDVTATAVHVNHCYLNNNESFNSTGPWLMYSVANSTLKTCTVQFDQPIKSDQRPFKLNGVIQRPVCNPVNTNPSVQYACFLAGSNGIYNTEISGSRSPFGMAVCPKNLTSMSFNVIPEKEYFARVYTSSSRSFNLTAFEVYDPSTASYVAVGSGTYTAPAGWSLVPLGTVPSTYTDQLSARLYVYGKAGWNVNGVYIDFICEK